jgi:hypothetical protein
MKYRLLIPALSLAMLITLIVYCLLLLVFWPFFFVFGIIIWKEDKFWRMNDIYISVFPDMPEELKTKFKK